MYDASFDYVLKLIFVFPGLMHMNVLAQHLNQSAMTYNKPEIPEVSLTYFQLYKYRHYRRYTLVTYINLISKMAVLILSWFFVHFHDYHFYASMFSNLSL